MAKKHKPKSGILPKDFRQAAPSGERGQLQEAVRELRHGNTDRVLRLAAQVQRTAKDPAVARVAEQIMAEAHFRAAANSSEPDRSLHSLDKALSYTPDGPRLHFHRGIALWQLGRLSEALAELEMVAKHEPDRPGLAYLRQLGRLASGQPWSNDGLSPAEANTLRLVEGFSSTTADSLEGPSTTSDSLGSGQALRSQRILPQGQWPNSGFPMQQKESAVQEESAVQALATPPLLGRDPRLWQALAEMRGDPAAAPSTLLQAVAASLGRKSINRILHYYRGVAALRRGDKENARAAWLSAKAAGLTTPWAVENLAYLLRERVLESAQAGRWEDVVNLASRLPAGIEDRILAETIGLAYYHLGYDAAQAGQWLTAANHWRKANEYTPSRYLAQNLALAEEALENWAQAAESWRDMVRRRPRKQDHPDYLTDAQIAAIWGHAAECYARVDNTTEEINCLKTALEYAPSDSALRLKLADVMHAAERGWAAQNELEQLLEKDPQNVDALLRLAALYDGSWGGDPESLWRRVLAIDPQNGEAREALAQHYIEKVRATTDNPMWPEKPPTFTSDYPLLLSLSRSDSEKIALLEEGLKELPEHPRLLLELGSLYARDSHKSALARQYLLRAYEAAPKDSRIASSALHELLHAKAGSVVEELLPQVRQIPGLLPAFWTNQAQMALHCKLGQNWIMRFFDEAIILAEQPWTQTTKAGQLIEAYVISYEEGAKDLAKQYEARIRNEVPGCGAVEYVEAHRLYHERHDLQGALRLIRKAKQIARKVNDAGVLAQAEETETMLSIGSMGLPDISAFLEQLDRQGLLPDFLDELDRKSRL